MFYAEAGHSLFRLVRKSAGCKVNLRKFKGILLAKPTNMYYTVRAFCDGI